MTAIHPNKISVVQCGNNFIRTIVAIVSLLKKRKAKIDEVIRVNGFQLIKQPQKLEECNDRYNMLQFTAALNYAHLETVDGRQHL